MKSVALDDGGFVVIGSRPPSALSGHRSGSVQSKQGYHTLSKKSAVDELLFGSAHPTKLDEAVVNFKAPWEYQKPTLPPCTFGAIKAKAETKPKPKGPPLLWCPTPGVTSYKKEKIKKKASLDDCNCLWSTRDRYRLLKHTPSFVDESLFSSKLVESSFEAPWNEKKSEKKRPQSDVWYPSGGSAISTSNRFEIDMKGDANASMKRPATALGISRRTSEKTARRCNGPMPLWRP